LIRMALDSKLRAIVGYDDILWKIRVGYAVVLYGALSLVLSKEGAMSLALSNETATRLTVWWTVLCVGALIIGFTLAASVIDAGFQVKKLKVVVARDALVGLWFAGFPAENAEHVKALCRIAGEMSIRELPEPARRDFWPKLWSNILWALLPLYSVAPIAALLAIYIVWRIGS